MGKILKACLFGGIFFTTVHLAATESVDNETIIESSLMQSEAWSQPEFGEPVEVDREMASVEGLAAPKEVQPWEYLQVQSVIPHTDGMSKSWYEQKVLREIDREDEAL